MAILNTNFTEELLTNTIRPEDRTGHDGNDCAVQVPKFTLQLSVSTKIVRTKEEGKTAKQFERFRLDAQDENALRLIFTAKNYSTNVWDGSRHSSNYVGMTGVSLDFDGGLTMEEAEAAFRDYNYVVHTSTSHMVEKNAAVAERFRVILPFIPGQLRFTTAAECEKVYLKLLTMYPQMDPACTDAGRQFFPFSSEKGADFQMHVHATGKYFDIDISDIPDSVVADEHEPYVWNGELRPKAELERILKYCPFVRWMDEHIANPNTEMHEPLKFALISILCRYETGRAEILRILSRDVRPTALTETAIDDKIERNLSEYKPQTYERIRRLGWPGLAPQGVVSPISWARVAMKPPKDVVYMGWQDRIVVLIDGMWGVVDLKCLKSDLLRQHATLQAVCPVCGHDHAEVKKDIFSFAYIDCDKCQKQFYESALTPGLFAFKGDLFRVEMKAEKFIAPEPLKEEHFHTKVDFKFVRRVIFNDPDRSFSSDDFQLRRIGSADFMRLGHEFDINDNAIILRYPALPVKVQDNDFINRFIENMFGQYAEFIKDWIAIYCYRNYVRLPIIVLAGDRYAGKGTFADTLVGKIFPRLFGLWDGDVKPFNPQFTNKLLFIDENHYNNKPEQYAELKRITGNERIPVNRKYENEFNAPNNLNIVISTNDARPIYLKWGEEPRDAKVNNFFIYFCKSADVVDNELRIKIEDRLGHYVRTEMKERYEKLSKTLGTDNRYTIAAPITEFAKELYASCKTSVEMEAEELAEVIVLGKHVIVKNDRGYEIRSIWYDPIEWNGDYYVRLKDIRDVIKFLDLRSGSTIKAYTEALNRLGVISMRSDYRSAKRQLGYKILRSKDYYGPSAGSNGQSGEEHEDLPF